MWRSTNAFNVLLLVAVMVCALNVVALQHKARKLYVELHEQKELAKQMEVEWGQLRLEQSTLAAPAKIEKAAVRQLQMQLPRSEQVRYIRVKP